MYVCMECAEEIARSDPACGEVAGIVVVILMFCPFCHSAS